jgi:gliding motility associated protien GldN
MNRLKLFTFVAGITLSFSVTAQEQSTTASSTSSARPIPDSDVMYKKTVWRAIDLREKQNQPMFSANREITKVIIEAVKRGELQAYANDSLTTPLTLQEFITGMSRPETEAVQVVEEDADAWGSAIDAPAAPAAPSNNEFFAKELYQLELVEDMIFDKKRSRMYHDIKALTLVIPSALHPAGIEKPFASFRYNDLARVFRNNPESAVWFNSQNDAQHKNLADAFDLWLFSSYITKVSNPTDRRLSDIYGGDLQGILAAQRIAEEMIEYEYNLWSY